MACIYYNAGHNLIQQAKNSPYYRNELVQFFPVHTNSAFKKAWNKINSKIETLFMYIHTGYAKGYGKIYMYREDIDLKISLTKKENFLKNKLKYIRIVDVKQQKEEIKVLLKRYMI